MPAYIGGPPWPELDDALARRDFPAAFALAEQDTRIDAAERQLVIGICRAMFHQSEQAIAALVDSMQTFGAQRPARAAVAADFLGRLHGRSCTWRWRGCWPMATHPPRSPRPARRT